VDEPPMWWVHGYMRPNRRGGRVGAARGRDEG
jgi:hypothetical protein